jgi:hypothetical protein
VASSFSTWSVAPANILSKLGSIKCADCLTSEEIRLVRECEILIWRGASDEVYVEWIEERVVVSSSSWR